MSKAQFGTFDDLLEITEESLRPVVTALREVIVEVDPNTCEVVRLGDRAATYGCARAGPTPPAAPPTSCEWDRGRCSTGMPIFFPTRGG